MSLSNFFNQMNSNKNGFINFQEFKTFLDSLDKNNKNPFSDNQYNGITYSNIKNLFAQFAKG